MSRTEEVTPKDMPVRQPVVIAVDDEPENLELLQRAFRQEYEIYSAHSGKEALELVQQLEKIDVLLVDQRMPEMKGTEFLRAVDELRPDADDIVRILITGYTDPIDIIESINVGRIDYYYTKPLVADDLRLHLLPAGRR